MKRVLKYVGYGFAGLFVVLVLVSLVWVRPVLSGAIAFGTKVVCNDINVSQLPTEFVLGNMAGLLPFGDFLVSNDSQRVSFSILGFTVREAAFESGYGCRVSRSYATRSLPVHVGADSSATLSLEDASRRYPALNAMISERFERFGEGRGDSNPANHRALIALHNGKVAAEHYSAPYTATTPQHSMSMAKSINALLWSIADDRGLASLDDPVHAPEWSGEDPRQAITNRDLLNMQSGLNRGNYDLAFLRMASTGDNAHYATQQTRLHPPGTHYLYADADSNLAARSLSAALEASGTTYQAFASEVLFGPIGADSFVLASDDYGYHFSSSLTYATARDWARVGQLLLNEGRFGQQQIVPARFFESLKTPLPTSQGMYRLSFWLNQGETYGHPRGNFFPGLPADTYAMSGLNGQLLVVIPSLDIVVLHLGAGREGWAGSGPAIEIVAHAVELIQNTPLPEIQVADGDERPL
ncbi:MAG: serine hydrolase [Pseudomonadota bacterium]